MEANKNRNCGFLLAYSVASLSVACGSLVSVPFDKQISWQHGLFLVALGTVFFVSLTDFCNKIMLDTAPGQRFRQKYRLLVSDVMDITNKIVSAIQAAFSCISGLMVCSSSCKRSFLTASHYASDAYAWFGCAYFIYDMWSMYEVYVQKIIDKQTLFADDERNANVPLRNGAGSGLYDKPTIAAVDDGYHSNGGGGGGADGISVDANQAKEMERNLFVKRLGKLPKEPPSFIWYCLTNPVMTIHHVFIGSFGLLVIVYLRGNFGDCVYAHIFLMEVSTPFVNIRGILSTMALKESPVYVVNGVLMLVTFFVFRLAMWPYLYYWYSTIANKTVLQTILSLPRTCKIGTMILFLPQVYWFYLMLRGAIKVFFPKTKSPRSSKHSGNEDRLTSPNQVQKEHVH